MIVCVCRAVSDRVIRAAVVAGASTVSEVSRACRAGSCCGACRPAIAQLIKDISPRHSASASEASDRESRIGSTAVERRASEPASEAA